MRGLDYIWIIYGIQASGMSITFSSWGSISNNSSRGDMAIFPSLTPIRIASREVMPLLPGVMHCKYVWEEGPDG